MALIRLPIFFLLLGGPIVLADEQRAHVNYMLHCQGCHLPEAEGFANKVPPMKDFVGYFLHSQEGREFLIRVPGVAHSALNDEELTELLNWVVQTFSAKQLPDDFRPFTKEEIAKLRDLPELDPEHARAIILADIASELPKLAAELR